MVERQLPASARHEYAMATLATLLAFALAFLADGYVSIPSLSMIFLTAVLAVAVRTRMSVAVYAAVVCFLGYNFFFVPPRYTLVIADADDLLAVSLFLVVALVCSRLATRLARQVDSLRAAQERARILLALGQRLAASPDADAMVGVAADALERALDVQAKVVVSDAAGVSPERSNALDPQTVVPAAGDPTRLELPMRVDARLLGTIVLTAPSPGLWDDRDHLALAQAMAQDIGLALERARLNAALEQARVQAETERLRNALLSSVSHDLRSPLVSMIGAAGTLATYEAQLPLQERRDLLQAIVDEGQRMDRYIQNLLDMARLGHGELQLRRDWVDADEIVLAALARLRRFFPQQTVVTDLPAETVLLYVHPALIEQALFNILENAAHFSPPGAAVRVHMRTDGERLRIEVTDHGPGIPEAERRRIFDTFFSVARGDRGQRGTGLGLSICRGMVGAHGGDVEALPADGGGTVMRVTLPLPSPPAPESAS